MTWYMRDIATILFLVDRPVELSPDDANGGDSDQHFAMLEVRGDGLLCVVEFVGPARWVVPKNFHHGPVAHGGCTVPL